MFILIPRQERPDAAYWPGRIGLAAADAVAWPALWFIAIASAPLDTGNFGNLAMALIVVLGVRRVHRAVWRNERYRFTTWRWGVPIATLATMAWALKLLA